MDAQLPQPPPGPDRGGEPARTCIARGEARARPRWASPTTATPTASASIDEKGNILWGDQLMILFSPRRAEGRAPGAAIVGEVKCSQTLYDDIAKHGGRAIMWKAGHSLIKAKMKEEHALARRRDERPHLLQAPLLRLRRRHLLRRAPARDPRARRGGRCRELLAGVPQDLRLAGDPRRLPRGEEVPRGGARHGEAAQGAAQIIDVDGVRVIFDGGWGLVRASNTQPILVLRFEANERGEAAGDPAR